MRRQAAAAAGAAVNKRVTSRSTRLLMSSSAAFLAVLGVVASFLPREIVSAIGVSPGWFTELVIQLAAAAWMGFAVLNWAARGTLLGGIYGRPIALGNFAQFAVGAVTLLKVGAHLRETVVLVPLAALYALFAIWFGYVLFGPGPSHPVENL